MHRLIAYTFIAALAAVAVSADETDKGLTGWQKTKLAAVYPLAIHQLPLTILHEGPHALVAAIFGAKPSLHLLPAYRPNANGGRSLSMASVETENEMSPAVHSFVLLAPYAVQLFVVDRFAERAYRTGRIRIDSVGDKYITNTLMLNEFTPLQDSFSKHGDFAKLAQHTHIPRVILGALVQTAYVVSQNRILKARGHENSTWEFYYHFTF